MQRKEAHFPFTLLLTCGFLSVGFQSSLADDVALASTTFRVITYNVQFLPEPVSSKNKRPQPEYRVGRIAEEVSPFDLQEIFHDRHRSILTGRLRAAWDNKLQALYSPTPKGFYTSGVMAQRLSVALKGGGRTQLRAGTSLRGTIARFGWRRIVARRMEVDQSVGFRLLSDLRFVSRDASTQQFYPNMPPVPKSVDLMGFREEV
jgi:hypothetical protein